MASRCTKFVFQKRREVIYILSVFAVAEGRFRLTKTTEEEELCVERAIPKSNRFKNKWTVGTFLKMATSAKCQVSSTRSWWSF